MEPFRRWNEGIEKPFSLQQKENQKNGNDGTDDDNIFSAITNILSKEEENSKTALADLWALKSSLVNENRTPFEALIQHYQKKVDHLRHKKEDIKKIHDSSLSLLEKRVAITEELNSINESISKTSEELNRLEKNLVVLETRQQQLVNDQKSMEKELSQKEADVLNSVLYILSEETPEIKKLEIETKKISIEKPVAQTKPEAEALAPEPKPEEPKETLEKTNEISVAPEKESITQKDLSIMEDGNKGGNEAEKAIIDYSVFKRANIPVSVVKTETGKVIAEYYYDPKAYKNDRHYILNGLFYMTMLQKVLDARKENDEDFQKLKHLIELVTDNLLKRAKNEPTRIHFEVATNEVLNDKILETILTDFLKAEWMDLQELSRKFHAKIITLQTNREAILLEQLANYNKPAKLIIN